MSLRYMRWAFSQPIPTTARFVLVALADFADDEGRAWPSVAAICEKTGIKNRAVRYAIESLEAAGLLSRHDSGRRSPGYVLNEEIEFSGEFSVRRAETEKPAPRATKGKDEAGTKCLKSGTSCHTEVASGATEVAPRAIEVASGAKKVARDAAPKNHQEPPRTINEPLPLKAPLVKSDPAGAVTIPDWIPTEPWNGFLEARKAKRVKTSDRAVKLLIAELGRLRAIGEDPGEVLDQSTMRGWTGVFPVKNRLAPSASQKNSNGGALHDRLQRRFAGVAA